MAGGSQLDGELGCGASEDEGNHNPDGGERALGKLMSQEVHAGARSSPYFSEELSTSALGKRPTGRRRSGLWQEPVN